MDEHLLFLIVGLGAGAAYAGLAMAVVTTYRGTGVINIAQGAMAMWSAFVFAELRTTGDLVLPVGHVALGGRLAAGPALAVGLASAVALALALHVVVFRPLRAAPPLGRVVASVGVTIVLQALVVLRFGTERVSVPPTFRTKTIEVGSLRFSEDRLWLAGVVITLAVALWAIGRFTRTGLATRAAAESERGAVLLGFDPGRLAALTWVLGAAVGALVAMLVAPAVGLEPITWTLYVVPALACALVGRMASVGVACGAGLGLGALQSEITHLSAESWWPWWATVGVGQTVPLLVIVAALFLVGDRLPRRGALALDALPAVPRLRPRPLPVALLVAAGAAAILLTGGSYRFGVISSMIAAVLALSLVVVTGLVGQISLAQAAFAGAAGFALSKIGTGLPFPVSLLAAALVSTGLGLLVAIPALRVRGVQLAVVTLAAAVAIEHLVFRNPELSPPRGNPIPDPSLFGVDLGVRDASTIARWPFGLLVLTILVVAALAVANLSRSSTGRALLAVRSNERAAASLGIDVARAKLVAFGLSSFLAGLGGALLGYSRGQLSADSFTVTTGLALLAFAYLGGITSVNGALVAGTLAPLGIGYVVLDRALGLGDDYFLVSGLLLVATAVLNPGGIAGRVRALVAAARQSPPHPLQEPDPACSTSARPTASSPRLERSASAST